MMVGREAGRQDLVPHVWGEKLRLINKSGSSWRWRRQGEGRAREEGFKSSPVKGPDTPCDKMKIIGDFEPLLMPTSVQGINICCAERCMCEVGTSGGRSVRCLGLPLPPLGHL